MSGYPPIEDHGVVGDLATVALVATDATIDFLCWPRFDSPTVFASLLDPDVDGGFLVAPRLGAARRRQHYLPESNILTTRFLSAEGMAEVTDFMPVCVDGAVQAVVRQVTTVRGEIDYRATCAPRFDYARVAHRTAVEGGSALFRPDDGGPALALRATVPLEIHGGDAVASFTLRAGETATFVLADPGHGESAADPHAFGCSAFTATLGFWRGWSAASRYRGRWRETVGRSALALKLLVSHAHGSLVAAPTFGLPEAVGGERNWDYRYT